MLVSVPGLCARGMFGHLPNTAEGFRHEKLHAHDVEGTPVTPKKQQYSI